MTRLKESHSEREAVVVEGLEEAEVPQSNDVFVFPASFSQSRLWFLDQLEPASPAYNIHAAIRMRGALDVEVLSESLQVLVERHEALRTVFSSIDGELSQVISPEIRLEIPKVLLSGLSAEALEAEIERLAFEEARKPFDIEVGPLLRASVIEIDANHHVLLLTVHHIIADGWSLGVLYSELSTVYKAQSTGAPVDLPELEIQYVDYAMWQKEFVEGEEVERQLAFWTERFGGRLPVLELPKKRSRPATRSSVGAKEWLSLDPSIVEKCTALCRREKITPYMLFLAALKVLFSKYSGQDDVIVGSPVANRSRAEIETSVGFYVNTVAYRADLSGGVSFRELLARVSEFSTKVYSNQDVPFEKVVETLNPDRDLSHNPLFQAMFTMQASPDDFLKLPGIETEFIEIDNGTAKFDLLIELQEKSGGIWGYFEYSSEIFAEDTIRRMARHYQSLLAQLVADPDGKIDDLSLLPRAERELIVETWNESGSASSAEGGVQQILRDAAKRHPSVTAVELDGASLTYQELDRRSSQIARHLIERGVERGARVGVCFRRSLEMVAAVAGVLKAGAAYVPIDPDYPADRRGYIAEDAKLAAMLTNIDDVDSPGDAPIVRLDASFATLDGIDDEDPEVDCAAEDLAYVIYTSGSTGKPKGVAMPHGPLVNLVAWQLEQSQVGEGSRTLQFASMSFDVSFQELFATFACGGTLVLVDAEMRKNPADLLSLMKDRCVERLFLPYIALQQLAEVGDLESIVPESLREVITAGEQLLVTPAIVRFFGRLSGCSLVNQYGPTESHVVTSFKLDGASGDWAAVPPIGRPITGARVYVLDARREPVPIGVTGELYIGGDVLALGYLDRAELTEERFVDDPFSGTSGARMYKTGDLSRFLPDGNIEFLGRTDHQVKIRGYRVEPDEVETTLSRVDSVREAFVVVQGDTNVDRRLAAYIVADEGHELVIDEIVSALKVELPEFMVPGVFFQINAPPLTPSGKVDRANLARCESARVLGGAEETVEPQGDVECKLRDIWQEVIAVEPIGVRDNFFDLGGHSILAVRLMARVKKSFGVDVPLATLFKAPTIEELAALIQQELDGPADDAAGPVLGERSWTCLVELQKGMPGSSKTPLFCVHGVGGNILRFSALVRRLGGARPCYGLQAKGVDGKQQPHECLREMAEFYVSELRDAQPKGPYMICGYSSGGVIAYEMAKQIVASGETVSMLTLFDTYHPDFYAEDSDQVLLQKKRREEGVWSSFVERVRVFQRHQSQRVKNQFIKIYKKLGKQLPPWLIPHNLAIYFYRASKDYQTGEFPGEILLLRSTTNAGDDGADLGWGIHARDGVKVITVPGTHEEFLFESHIEEIWKHLGPAIAERE